MNLAWPSLSPVLILVHVVGCSSSSSPPRRDAGSDALRDSSIVDTAVDPATEQATDPPVDMAVDQPGSADMGPMGEAPASCNEVTGMGCTPPLKCGLDCTTTTITCLSAGAKVLGDMCATENECGAGL